MHIWYDVDNKNTYQKKIHQTILILLILPIIIVFILFLLLIGNQGDPLQGGSFLHILSILIFLFFFLGIGILSLVRNIKSNILKFIFVRTIHNKLLILHIEEEAFTKFFGKAFVNSRVSHSIISQIRGAVENLQNINTTQQILNSFGNFQFLYNIETETTSYEDYGWKVVKVLRISNRLFYYHITYQAKRGERYFETSINIPKSYPDLEQLLYAFRQKAN